MGKKLKTDPSEEPLTLDEAKAHLRQTESADDALITNLIYGARGYVEDHTGRAMVTQTWQLFLDDFPGPYRGGEILLPLPPLQQVTSLTYLDSDGVAQTLDSTAYVVDVASEPARITPAADLTWPDTQKVANAVTVEFVCGYGAAVDVPQILKQAMLLMIGEMYETTEESTLGRATNLPLTVERLLWRHKVIA